MILVWVICLLELSSKTVRLPRRRARRRQRRRWRPPAQWARWALRQRGARRAGTPTALTNAQAAALGLSHAPAPGAPQARALLPAQHLQHAQHAQHAPHAQHAQLPQHAQHAPHPAAHDAGDGYCKPGCEAQVRAQAAPRRAPPTTTCRRRPTYSTTRGRRSYQGNHATKHYQRTERNLLELADPSGPPTLATSALHALDLQFCAQGVTTIHPPTTPPYPPPQQMFPVQQLATNLNQHQLQELQQQQFQQLAAQQQQQQEQQKKQQPQTTAA
ncbi:hypothetical protein ACJJTC_007214, partial [Scirpophaga incertulas]